jgi:hypothetical protein
MLRLMVTGTAVVACILFPPLLVPVLACIFVWVKDERQKLRHMEALAAHLSPQRVHAEVGRFFAG